MSAAHIGITVLLCTVLTAAAVSAASVTADCRPDEFPDAHDVCQSCSWCQKPGLSDLDKQHRDQTCRDFASGCVWILSQDAKLLQTTTSRAVGSTETTSQQDRVENQTSEPAQSNHTTPSWTQSTRPSVGLPAWAYATSVCVLAVVLTIVVILILLRYRRNSKTIHEAANATPSDNSFWRQAQPLLAHEGMASNVSSGSQQPSDTPSQRVLAHEGMASNVSSGSQQPSDTPSQRGLERVVSNGISGSQSSIDMAGRLQSERIRAAPSLPEVPEMEMTP